MEEKGYIHVYTGNGKGKTTAAFGIAIRALCAGKKVFIGQFIKSMKYNETKIENIFDNVVIKQFGDGCFIQRNPEEKDINMAKAGLFECSRILQSGKYDMVILDELNVALSLSLLSIEDILHSLNARNPQTEVIITGRYAPKELLEIADLITEMKEIKHYYTQGVLSREGIDK